MDAVMVESRSFSCKGVFTMTCRQGETNYVRTYVRIVNGSWGNMPVFLGKTCSCCWGKHAHAHVHLLMSDRGVGASASSCCSISDSGVMREVGGHWSHYFDSSVA